MSGLKAVVTGIEWDLVGKVSIQCDECRDVYETQVWKFPRPERRVKLAEDLREAGLAC